MMRTKIPYYSKLNNSERFYSLISSTTLAPKQGLNYSDFLSKMNLTPRTPRVLPTRSQIRSEVSWILLLMWSWVKNIWKRLRVKSIWRRRWGRMMKQILWRLELVVIPRTPATPISIWRTRPEPPISSTTRRHLLHHLRESFTLFTTWVYEVDQTSDHWHQPGSNPLYQTP